MGSSSKHFVLTSDFLYAARCPATAPFPSLAPSAANAGWPRDAGIASTERLAAAVGTCRHAAVLRHVARASQRQAQEPPAGLGQPLRASSAAASPGGAIHHQGNRRRPRPIGQQLDRGVGVHDRRRLHGGHQQHAVGRLPELPGQGIGPTAGIDHYHVGPEAERRSCVINRFQACSAVSCQRTSSRVPGRICTPAGPGCRTSASGRLPAKASASVYRGSRRHCRATSPPAASHEQAALSLLGQGHRQVHGDRRRAHAALAAEDHDPPRPGRGRRVRRGNLADEGSEFGGLIHG